MRPSSVRVAACTTPKSSRSSSFSAPPPAERGPDLCREPQYEQREQKEKAWIVQHTFCFSISSCLAYLSHTGRVPFIPLTQPFSALFPAACGCEVLGHNALVEPDHAETGRATTKDTTHLRITGLQNRFPTEGNPLHEQIAGLSYGSPSQRKSTHPPVTREGLSVLAIDARSKTQFLTPG